VGIVIPTIVLAAVEEHSKFSVLATHGGSPLFQNSKTILMYSFFLLPFLASIAFDFVVLAVKWLC
jgi:hypothetical protein